MKKVIVVLALIAMAGIASANLLTNGNMESPGVYTADPNDAPDLGDPAANWTTWSWNNGWSETATKTAAQGGNGTWVLNVGNGWYDGGGGAYQIVPATPGQSYLLSVDSGADAWWQPTGEMALIWLDGTGAEISKDARFTVDPAVYGYTNDTPHPMQRYYLGRTAPAGTAQVKVEFASRMPGGVGGSVTFDNAVLDAVPEPATMILLGLGGLLLRKRS